MGRDILLSFLWVSKTRWILLHIRSLMTTSHNFLGGEGISRKTPKALVPPIFLTFDLVSFRILWLPVTAIILADLNKRKFPLWLSGSEPN